MSYKYNIIYADPPWKYSSRRAGGNMKSGASQQYDCMSLEELYEFGNRVQKVCKPDCALFMWVTVPFLDSGLEVLRQWGFKYKTSFTWIKTGRIGMGWWFRVNTEILLVGLRGIVKPFGSNLRNWYMSAPEGHSKKPDYFYKVIKTCGKKSFGKVGTYLELFARSNRRGWKAFGNAKGLDIIPL